MKIKKLSSDAKLPHRAHEGDAGVDLFSISDVTLPPHEPVKIATGIAVAVPHGCVGMICDRSSLGARGIRTLGGIVDAGYRGEVQVLLINLRNEPAFLAKGDKIAQMLLIPVNLSQVQEVDTLDDTSRGAGGFGSSGR